MSISSSSGASGASIKIEKQTKGNLKLEFNGPVVVAIEHASQFAIEIEFSTSFWIRADLSPIPKAAKAAQSASVQNDSSHLDSRLVSHLVASHFMPSFCEPHKADSVGRNERPANCVSCEACKVLISFKFETQTNRLFRRRLQLIVMSFA